MLGFLASLTLRGRILLGGAVLLFVIAVVAGLYFAGNRDGRTAEQVKQAEIATQAVTQARKADGAAQTAVEAEKASTGAEIERGREAAAQSTGDVWKDATEAMKNSGTKPGGGPAR